MTTNQEAWSIRVARNPSGYDIEGRVDDLIEWGVSGADLPRVTGAACRYCRAYGLDPGWVTVAVNKLGAKRSTVLRVPANTPTPEAP